MLRQQRCKLVALPQLLPALGTDAGITENPVQRCGHAVPTIQPGREAGIIRLFIMGKDEDEKIKQASLLIQRHGDNPHVELYIFSDSIESSLLTQTMQPKGMKVRRISDAKSLINDILYRNGSMLFEQADGSADKNKDISAVVLGLGSYGTQMLKALPWFGQMDGYNLTITAVDLQRDAADRFAFQCPELC